MPAIQPVNRAAATRPSLRDRVDQKIFHAIWSRSLVYNTCWEDPAVDRIALDLRPDDHVLVITSAGCNALDYALAGPRRVDCVDANPRQNALLELKLAGIAALPYEDFYAIFGEGHHEDFARLYRTRLRPQLSPFAREWWDRHTQWFASARGSFYFHGLSGLVARGVRTWFRAQPRLRVAMFDLLAAGDLETQRRIYDKEVAPLLWNRAVNWTISRQLVMNLLGVPHPQRRLVQAEHADGVSGFIRSAVQYVFRELPLADNYFYRVYLTGRYAPDCCPEYLKRDNFERLKGGLAASIRLHTTTVTGFLQDDDTPISRFVLLDHMDWMGSYHPAALDEEWNAILTRAAPEARILLRSAQSRPAWLDQVRLADGATLRDRLRFDEALAESLQPRDRVHTYPGLVIADAPA